MKDVVNKCFRLFMMISLALLSVQCTDSKDSSNQSIDYNLKSNWTYYQDTGNAAVDVFFVAPTVYLGNDNNFNMNLQDSITKYNFLGATNMEIGIYNQSANVFAPYYRQLALSAYAIRSYKDKSERSDINTAFDLAYFDVLNSFRHYLSISDRPFVLAGFSQGSELLLRLMKEEFDSPQLQSRLIAAYLIGWRITPADYAKYRYLKPASSEGDLGVIVSFNTESPEIERTIIVPHETISINPLTWSTDTNYADKSLNKGAVFINYSGEIENEIPFLTGAYICPNRGTLKVRDINAKDYPPILSIFTSGEYHIYDYIFFYRNLQSNVSKRIKKYLSNYK